MFLKNIIYVNGTYVQIYKLPDVHNYSGYKVKKNTDPDYFGKL